MVDSQTVWEDKRMDDFNVGRLRNQLHSLRATATAAASTRTATVALGQTTFPVLGPVVMIHSLPLAADAIKSQNDCLVTLIGIVELMFEEMA